MKFSALISAIFLFGVCNLFAQAPSHLFTFDMRLSGSVNSLGSITRINPALGYNFNSHFSASAGVPFYLAHPSDSSIATAGAVSANGVGDPYLQLRYSLSRPLFGFASTLTGTAPAGDQSKGFSTGHATVDWSNYAEVPVGKLTPFGELGFANSVSDTQFFIRPYTSKGFVTHVQGGAGYNLVRAVSVYASVYAVHPSGSQTVTSRIKTSQKASSVMTAMTPAGNGRGNQHVFETASVTTGSSDIARDRGYSVWLRVSPVSSLGLYGGYTRSTTLALNTLFIGVGISIGDLFHPKND
jgi:hypothetical protein